MRFYDREQEVAFLRETRVKAESVARFTVVTGRRRIGKTTLIREAYKDVPFVYFFVARKAESDLCDAYLEEISEKLGVEFKEQLLETSNTLLKDNLQLMIQFNIGDQYRMFVRLMRNLMLILDKAQVYQKERTQLFIYNFEYMREHGGQFDRHFGAYNVKNIVEISRALASTLRTDVVQLQVSVSH